MILILGLGLLLGICILGALWYFSPALFALGMVLVLAGIAAVVMWLVDTFKSLK